MLPDPDESNTKFLDAESVYDRVDGRVAMSKQDGHVDEVHSFMFGKKQCNAVQYVQG